LSAWARLLACLKSPISLLPCGLARLLFNRERREDVASALMKLSQIRQHYSELGRPRWCTIATAVDVRFRMKSPRSTALSRNIRPAILGWKPICSLHDFSERRESRIVSRRVGRAVISPRQSHGTHAGFLRDTVCVGSSPEEEKRWTNDDIESLLTPFPIDAISRRTRRRGQHLAEKGGRIEVIRHVERKNLHMLD